jgi:hypothetical protein
MARAMSPAERHKEKVAAAGCAVCRRLHGHYVPPEVHHVAEGSSKRSDFATVGLCGPQYENHHQGPAGLHGMGVKRFCALYRVPFENEYGLLVWAAEDIARYT